MNMDQSVSEELARRDLADIRSLRESAAFDRYWVRRLKDKRHAEMEKFLKDGTLTHEQREISRALVLAYDDLINMAGVDEASIIRGSLIRHLAPQV